MTYRLYFNCRDSAPYVWSVDEGTQATEQIVRDVIANGCPMQTRALPPAKAALVDPKVSPIVWLEIRGTLRIDDGIAKFTPC